MISLGKAVENGVVLQIRYEPNVTGGVRTGWRTVLPLDLYSHRGKKYLLCWFSSGSSVSGTSGWRLYLVEHIQEYRETNTDVQQPFALERLTMRGRNFKVQAWYMIKTNQVEI